MSWIIKSWHWLNDSWLNDSWHWVLKYLNLKNRMVLMNHRTAKRPWVHQRLIQDVTSWAGLDAQFPFFKFLFIFLPGCSYYWLNATAISLLSEQFIIPKQPTSTEEQHKCHKAMCHLRTVCSINGSRQYRQDHKTKEAHEKKSPLIPTGFCREVRLHV